MGFSKMAVAVLAAAAAPFLGAGVEAYADPGSCSGDCFAHDPAMIIRESDNTYFRFNTGSEIGIWSADSIEGPWTYLGAALPDGSSIDLDGNTDLWAPDVHNIDGTYYLYYAVSTSASQNSAIGYATSTTMEYGSWTDHGSTGISSSSSKDYNAIDPNLFVDGDSYYMNFGSFWGDLYQAPMGSAAKVSGASYNVEYQPSGTHPCEGAFMYEYDDYYYLFWSEGICCDYDTSMPADGAEYKVRVCRSSSATGDFVDADGTACTDGGGTTVLASHDTVYGPGGQGIIDDPTNGVVMYYHYADTTIGYSDADYQFGWNVLTWTDGWPTV